MFARGAPHPCLLVFEGRSCDLGRQYGCVENDEKREANPIEKVGGEILDRHPKRFAQWVRLTRFQRKQ